MDSNNVDYSFISMPSFTQTSVVSFTDKDTYAVRAINQRITLLNPAIELGSIYTAAVRQPSVKRTPRNYFPPPPIHRLPFELLSAIFTTCMPGERSFVDCHAIPLLLGQICRHWRHVALSTTSLWRYIHVVLGRGKSAAWVPVWLSRSAGCSLSVMIYGLTSSEDASATLHSIIQHAHRWEDLDISLPGQLFHSFASIRWRLPLLRKVKMVNTADKVSSLRMCFDAPNLERIELSFGLEKVEPLSAALTHCTLRYGLLDCVEFIRRHPQITHCSLHDCPTSPVPLQAPIVAQLVSLHVSNYTRHGVTAAFECLTLPALREVSIALGNATPFPLISFMGLLSRSGYRLDHLAIHSGIIPIQNLISLLQRIPSLKKLEIHQPDTLYIGPLFFDQLVQRLTCGPFSPYSREPILLPNLRSLSLCGRRLRINGDIVADMIQSRWHQRSPDIARLRAVALQGHSWDPKTAGRLEYFRREGLQVIL